MKLSLIAVASLFVSLSVQAQISFPLETPRPYKPKNPDIEARQLPVDTELELHASDVFLAAYTNNKPIQKGVPTWPSQFDTTKASCTVQFPKGLIDYTEHWHRHWLDSNTFSNDSNDITLNIRSNGSSIIQLNCKSPKGVLMLSELRSEVLDGLITIQHP